MLDFKAVPRQFMEDFELVVKHYDLHESGEYETAKQAARRKIDDAIKAYAALAAEIRRG